MSARPAPCGRSRWPRSPRRQRAPGRGAQRGRDAHAGDRRGVRQHRDHQGRRGLHLLGLDRLPHRRAVQLRDGPRRRRGVAAPRREPRGDGRGLGPLRGVGLLQEGEIDAALVYSFGRSSLGDLNEILALQLDPYYLAPLWPDPVAWPVPGPGLHQRRPGHRGGIRAIAARSRKDALANPNAQVARTSRWPPCSGTPTSCRR